MHGFVEFVDKKMRENRRHLGLVKKILEQNGMKVTDHRQEDDPYIFVNNTEKTMSFDGIRIYKIGDIMAYRVQKQENTHPYGRAYPLDLEEMYEDYMADDFKEEEVAKQIVQSVAEEMKKFFKKSAEAENDIRSAELDQNQDGMGKIIVRTTGTDYSNMVSSKS
jgi:hypothetical protein